MKQLNLYIRWSWRDLRARWLQVFVIALVIALSVAVFAGLSGQGEWRNDSLDMSYGRLHMYDLRLELAENAFVDQTELVEALSGIEGVSILETRLTAPTLVSASTGAEDVLVRGRMVGVDVSEGGPHVNTLYVEQDNGRSLTSDDAGHYVAVVESKFAEYYGLEPGDPLRVSGDITLDFVGMGISPEYFVVMPESGAFVGEASFAVLFVPITTVQALTGREGLVNDAVMILDDSADPERVRSSVETHMLESFPAISTEVTRVEDDYIYSSMYEETETIQETWSAIGMLFLIGAGVGAFNLIGRMVEAQRRQIGIGMALGVPRRWIAFRPMLVGIQVALLGLVIGPLLGWGLGRAMASYQQSTLQLPYTADSTFYVEGFARGAVLAIIIPILAVLFPIWRAIRVQPVDAITSGYLVAKGGGLNRLAGHLALPGKSFIHMPIRNILRAPWRTLLTILGLTIAILLLIFMAGMMDTYVETMHRIGESYEDGNPDRLMVSLDKFYPVESTEIETLRQATKGDGTPLFQATETSLITGAHLQKGESKHEITLELHTMSDAIWVPDLIEGQLQTEEPGIVISDKSATDLGVNVGDTVILEHVYREGSTAFRWVESEIRVIGIHDNPLRHLSYLDMQYAGMLGLEGYTNYLIVDPLPGISSNDVKLALLKQPTVTAAKTASEFTESTEDYLATAMDMLKLLQGVMLILAFLITFNSVSISLDERVREIATMFAFGLPIRTVTRMQMLENFSLGVIATVIGTLAGWLVLKPFMASMQETAEVFSFIVTISPSTLLVAMGLGILVVVLTPLFSIRRMRRMDIPSTLRVME